MPRRSGSGRRRPPARRSSSSSSSFSFRRSWSSPARTSLAVPRRNVRRRQRGDHQLVPGHGVYVPAEDEPRPRAGSTPAEDAQELGLELRRRRSHCALVVQGGDRTKIGHAAGINNSLETKIRGLVTPVGRSTSRRSTTGIQLDSMWVGTVQNCKVKPLAGAAFARRSRRARRP